MTSYDKSNDQPDALVERIRIVSGFKSIFAIGIEAKFGGIKLDEFTGNGASQVTFVRDRKPVSLC